MSTEHNQVPRPDQPDVGVPTPERVRQVSEEVHALLQAGDEASASALLAHLHPVDQTSVILDLPEARRGVLLAALPVEIAARIVEEMEPEDAAVVAEQVTPETFSHVLDEVGPEVAADVLHAMGAAQAQRALDSMEESATVIPLLEYPDDTAGGLMTTEYASVFADATAATALDVLRVLSEAGRDLTTIFAVDGDGRLVGQVSIRRLALARQGAMVRSLMDERVVHVLDNTDQEACALMMKRYDLPELPVVDAEQRLIGVIAAEALQDVAEEEATEDMYRIAGISRERVLGPARRSVRSRLPWLTLNLATTFAAAAVVSAFESTIARVAVLAAFLPVVAGQGGIGGTQTLTLIVRSIALGELAGRRAARVLAREAWLGVVHGVVLGVLVAVVALAWRGDPVLGLVLGTAMLGNMIVAGFVGAGVPLLLRRLRQDPAVSAAIVVTTATDITGFFLFLGLATLLIDRLA